MALDSVSVSDGVTAFTYNLVSQTAKEAIYRESLSTLQNPRTLRVSHEEPKNSSSGSDRHLVQFNRTDDNADGDPFVGQVHVVITAPRDGVTLADMKLEWEKLKDLIDNHEDEILGGFFPG